MTYGWAILVAVIVIAVLASFHVFDPLKYISNSTKIYYENITLQVIPDDFSISNLSHKTIMICDNDKLMNINQCRWYFIP